MLDGQPETSPRSFAKPIRVLYIGGYGRSGSTVLDLLLGATQGLFSAGELRHVWNRSFALDHPCGCGRRFRECGFWTQVVERAFGSFRNLDAEAVVRLKRSVDRIKYIPHLLSPRPASRYAARLDAYGEILSQLYEGIRSTAGCKVIVDSSKDPSYAFLLARLPAVELHVLHLVRDSRAVAFSWSRKRRMPGTPDGLMPRFSPVVSAFRWNVYNAPFHLLRNRAATYRLLRYEDFVRDPQSTVKRILQGLGTFAPPCVDEEGTVRLGTNHTVTGNPLRFRRGRIRLRLDEEWRVAMPRLDRAAVSVLTFPLLLRYGYPFKT